MKMNNFPKHFIDAIQAKECILFIGSGTSMWSGLPSWEGLIKKMVEFLSERGLKLEEQSEINQIILQEDLLTAASLCVSRMRKVNCHTKILTREHYRALRPESKGTIGTLPPLFISRPVVYFGFGLRDPDF